MVLIKLSHVDDDTDSTRCSLFIVIIVTTLCTVSHPTIDDTVETSTRVDIGGATTWLVHGAWIKFNRLGIDKSMYKLTSTIQKVWSVSDGRRRRRQQRRQLNNIIDTRRKLCKWYNVPNMTLIGVGPIVVVVVGAANVDTSHQLLPSWYNSAPLNSFLICYVLLLLLLITSSW